jgi:hypothetical protein
MTQVTFRVKGLPATHSTKGEKSWRDAMITQIPLPSLETQEAGLILSFLLESLVRRGHPLDVENLCEPALCGLINRKGWFRGSRPFIRWLRATKAVASITGCEITITSKHAPDLPVEAPDWDEVYTGKLPTSATSPELANWAWCDPSTHRRALSVCHPSTNRPDKGLRSPTLASSRTGAGSAILPRRANYHQCPC